MSLCACVLGLLFRLLYLPYNILGPNELACLYLAFFQASLFALEYFGTK
jgi:hypothetical protein